MSTEPAIPPRPPGGYPDEFFASWRSADDFTAYFDAWPGDPHGDFAGYMLRNARPAPAGRITAN